MIDPETGVEAAYTFCDLDMITTRNMSDFESCLIVLDDMEDKINKKDIP